VEDLGDGEGTAEKGSERLRGRTATDRWSCEAGEHALRCEGGLCRCQREGTDVSSFAQEQICLVGIAEVGRIAQERCGFVYVH